MATRHEDSYTITRVTLTLAQSFDATQARLESALAPNAAAPAEPAGAAQLFQHLSSRADFEAAVRAQLGPHGFMLFSRTPHDAWTRLFGVPAGRPRRATKFVLGNPLVAITMIEHDVHASLFVPLEALLVERADGKGTDIVYVRPSTLIAGYAAAGAELRAAAEALDVKLEMLWEWVADGE